MAIFGCKKAYILYGVSRLAVVSSVVTPVTNELIDTSAILNVELAADQRHHDPDAPEVRLLLCSDKPYPLGEDLGYSYPFYLGQEGRVDMAEQFDGVEMGRIPSSEYVVRISRNLLLATVNAISYLPY